MNACLRAALEYLDLGWSALAICPPHHRRVPEYHARTCQHRGKRPLGTWKVWQRRLPTVDELVGQWEASPWSNVGIVLGPVSGLVGIDVDGPAGELFLGEISQGDLPPTLAFRTGKGLRLLFQWPSVPLASRVLRDVGGELRVMVRGVTVMPPSRHANGRTYSWLRHRGPGHISAFDAPEWLGGPLPWTGTGAMRTGAVEGAAILEGQRNDRLFRIGCALRRHGCTEVEILDTIRRVNLRCVPPLEDTELEHIARSSSRYTPRDQARNDK